MERMEPALAEILLAQLEAQNVLPRVQRVSLDGYEEVEMWERMERTRTPTPSTVWVVTVLLGDSDAGERRSSIQLRYAMRTSAADARSRRSLRAHESSVRIVAEPHLRLDLDMILSGRVPLAAAGTIYLGADGRVEQIDGR